MAKRKAPKLTIAGAEKALRNPRTPKQLRPFFERRLKELKRGRK